MRLLASLLVSLLLVGAGYLIFDRFIGSRDTIERSETNREPAAPAPAPPPNPPLARAPSNPPPALTPAPAPVAPAATPAASPKALPIQTSTEAEWSEAEKGILQLVNKERATAKLPPLEPEDGLRKCAIAQSTDMLDRGFFDHVNPSGEDPADRVSRIHRRLVGTSGENIWKGTGGFYATHPDLAGVIMDGWMQSPGHRANILRPEFTHLGVGVVIRGGEVRATQSFARVRAYLNAPLPEIVAAGSQIDLSTQGLAPAAEMYCLETFRGNHLSGAQNQPQPVSGGSMDASPGRYAVRFYFRNQSGYTLFLGPSFVTSKPK
jgi:uncharacterized protein YkwD